MSISEISQIGAAQLLSGNAKNQPGLAGQQGSKSEFAATMALRIAEFRTQAVSGLISSALGGNDRSGNKATGVDALFDRQDAAAGPLAALNTASPTDGLSLTGRNTALFDPESAYKMMSVINTKEVVYKAQFSELSEMKSFLTEMQHDGENLGQISASSDNASIRSQLQFFAEQYNAWTQRFDADMQTGGLLADTQAAQVSRYELKQSVENIFNGATDGLHGLRDLGLTIDPVSKLASLDPARLDTVLASNKSGAVNALHEFAANFAKSAALLNSDGNFIPNRLSNLDRVIDYIADNKTALQAEFGLGDPAKPPEQIVKALAAYQQAHGA